MDGLCLRDISFGVLGVVNTYRWFERMVEQTKGYENSKDWLRLLKMVRAVNRERAWVPITEEEWKKATSNDAWYKATYDFPTEFDLESPDFEDDYDSS